MSKTSRFSTQEVVTMTIAVIAVLVSLYSVWLARDHNRKSVVPFLVVQYERERRKITEQTDPYIRLAIKNNGAGVARITDLRIRSTNTDATEFNEILRVTGIGRFLFVHGTSYSLPSYLRAGDLMPIITTDKEALLGQSATERTDNLRRIVHELDQLTVEVEYESLYGAQYTAFRRSGTSGVNVP